MHTGIQIVTDAKRYNQQGEQALARGDYPSALAAFKAAVDLEPGSVVVLNNLGSTCWKLGDANQAIHYLQLAVAADPEHRLASLNLGRILIHTGRVQEAWKCFGAYFGEFPFDEEISNEILKAQRLSSLTEITQPMVLISEIQRSGGTLLSQLFDDHPQCHVHPYEIHWGRPMKWDWPAIDWSNINIEMLVKQLFEFVSLQFIRDGYTKEKAPDAVHPFALNLPLQAEVFRYVMRSRPSGSQRDVLNAYMTAYFYGWMDYQNLYRGDKKYIVGFIARLNMHKTSTEAFFRDYPDGYFISLVRHPGSWYASARSHKVVGNKYADDYRDIDKAMDLWTNSVESSLALIDQYGDQVILIQFERLISDTRTVMMAVCERIGIDWHETLLTPTFNSRLISANSSFQDNKFGVRKDVLKRYEQLTNDEQDLIKERAFELYKYASDKCIL